MPKKNQWTVTLKFQKKAHAEDFTTWLIERALPMSFFDAEWSEGYPKDVMMTPNDDYHWLMDEE